MIKTAAKSTERRGVASELGGFGAVFDLKAAGYEDPILITGTDGVGTKLLVASKMGHHTTIGIDLVAMCVNDLVVHGAEPLLFLDYFAIPKLDIETGKAIIDGIAEGCRRAGCALIGGETAEMPGMYSPKKYDLAGFCVGAVERDGIITGDKVKEGDSILGLASSGLHSNGFSLVRHVIDKTGMKYEAPAPFAEDLTLGTILLKPTRIYAKPCLAAIKAGGVHALAHITGGGFIENIPRILPTGLGATICCETWTPGNVFKWLAAAGNIKSEEMLRTFNCGIGMVLVVDPGQTYNLKQILSDAGEMVFEIGKIVKCDDSSVVSIKNQEALWKK